MPQVITLDLEAQNPIINQDESEPAKLKVIGVGGGGCNAIESMYKRGLNGVEYVAINTDLQVLKHNSANHKIHVGNTRGLGAGADPRIGRNAIEEDGDKIEEIIKGSDMVFVTAGMGGGTGTGGAPMVAKIAKSFGALVVGIVTKPFKWEGKKRMLNAEEGINELQKHVDSLIVIPNERLLNILDKSVSASEAFDKPNEVLYEATRGIADIITITGIINVDFADVRAVMKESGEALMGSGTSSGEHRAVEAAQSAISSPLLEGVNIKGAKNILLNVTGSDDLTMQEINEGNQIIYDAAGEDANVIFGWVNKPEMGDNVSYTVIATGFHSATSKPVDKGEDHLFEEKKSSPNVGGFSPQDYEIGEDENIDIPTIDRVRAKQMNNMNSDPISQSGFQFDAFSPGIDETEKDKEEKKNKRDDDSSSFLKMMMD
jgi:cell division protein FtsZ